MEHEHGHETIEHTADMGISGWGIDEIVAFEEVALAMFELIVDGEGLEPKRNVDITAEGNSYEELLVDFLNVLLMKADIDELVFLDIEMKFMLGDAAKDEYYLSAVARGVPRELVGERLLREVKGATYYGVSVGCDESGNKRATVVVDL